MFHDDCQRRKIAWGMHRMDQIAASCEEKQLTVEKLLSERGVELQPHEKSYPNVSTICPFSRCLFLCPLDKRLKCKELECDYWLNKLNEGER